MKRTNFKKQEYLMPERHSFVTQIPFKAIFTETMVTALRALVREQKESSSVRLGALVKETFDQIFISIKNRFTYNGILSGFSEIDRATSGFQDSDLIVLAARPGMGKTALALNIARNAAVEAKVPVMIFSLAMPARQLSMRFLGAESLVALHRICSGFVTRDDVVRLLKAQSILNQAPIYLDDSPGLTPADIRNKVRRHSEKEKIGLVIIDDFQSISNECGLKGRTLEMAENARLMKIAAMELRVPVIVTAQLNREVDWRAEKQPRLSDLGEIGTLDQVADLAMLIYRDEVYNDAPDNPDRGMADITIAKNRHGPTRNMRLEFIGAYTLFRNPNPNGFV